MLHSQAITVGLLSCLVSLDLLAQVCLSGAVEDKYSCPHGWTRYGGKKCLKYVNELQDYERAQATCRSKNQGTLVTVHSHEEQNFVYSYIHSIAASSTPIWLGAKQIDFESILWLDKTDNSYVNWAPSEPSHPDEICIAINPRNGLWHDVMCTEANVPACERAPTTQWPFFVAFCSEGWFQFNDEKCVRIISSQALNFYESQELCRSKYNSKLLSIKTDKESEFVHNLIKFRDVKLPVWLGAVQNDFSSFNWIDKSDVTFTNWAEGEPNDPDHACISMVASGGKWSDNDCKEQKLILCQKVVPEEGSCETGWLQFRQDKCYRFVHIRLAFDDAETLCNNLYGGHLPSIHSQEEQFIVAQFLASVNVKNGSEIWLGGRQMDFHNFNWGDGSPFNYSYWEQGEPSFPAEKCIEMSWRNGRWNDINCRLKRAVLCERQVSSRHLLKPILYQPTTCLETNCTANGGGGGGSGGGNGGGNTALASVVLTTGGSTLTAGAPDQQLVQVLASPGDHLQVPSMNASSNSTTMSSSSNLTTQVGAPLSSDPIVLLPDDKPIKVITSIMNRDQQHQTPSPLDPQISSSSSSSSSSSANRSTSGSSNTTAGLTSKSAYVSGEQLAEIPNANLAALNQSAQATIHYNLPAPERALQKSPSAPSAVAAEEQFDLAEARSEQSSPSVTAAAAAATQDHLSGRAPPPPASSHQQQEQASGDQLSSTASLLDKLKQSQSVTLAGPTAAATVASTSSTPASILSTTTAAAASVAATKTNLPEFTNPSDTNTTALNAPAVAAELQQTKSQQQQQQADSAQAAGHLV